MPTSPTGDEGLGEGEIHVEGVLLVGAVEVESSSRYLTRDLRCAPSETATVCLPVNMTQKSVVQGDSLDKCWALKNYKYTSEPEQDLLCRVQQFMAVDFLAGEFAAEFRSAFKKHLLLEQQESAAGPRSITQVRKDRDKERGAASVPLEESADSSETSTFETGDLTKNEGANVAGHSATYAESQHQDMARIDSESNQVTVVVLFTGCLRGKTRFGAAVLQSMRVLQYSAHNSSVAAPTSSVSHPTTSGVPSADRVALAEFLQIQCYHVRSAELSETRRHSRIEVTLNIRNLHAEDVSVNVEAVDRRSADQSPRKPATRGFRWDGKTKHCNISIKAQEKCSLVFHALISKPGVFDLKR
jgi:hypothetical protein